MDTALPHRPYCDRNHTRADPLCTSAVTTLHGVLTWATDTTPPQAHLESHGADLDAAELNELIQHLQHLHDQL